MIQLLEETTGDLVALRASGKLRQQDYDLMLPVLEEKIRQHGKIRVYAELEFFEAITPKALWEELKFDLKYASSVRKAAVVGNRKWEEWLTAAAKPFIGGEMRYFDFSQREAAWAWIHDAGS